MLTDIYILASERSIAVAKKFITTWLSGFNESASEYSFPQYSSKPEAVYSSVDKLLNILMKASNEPHSIYWNNPKNDSVRSGMLFFTFDGAMIAGLSVATEDAKEIVQYMKELADTIGGQFGYKAFEEPPPETVTEFIELTKAMPGPKLIKGSIIV